MKSWNILACFYICMFAANAATTFCNPMSIPDTPVGILCRDCRDGDMWRDFVDPPDSAKPWCYWWWVNGHVDRETITADLESMKRLGFGGILMFDSRGYWDDADHVVNPKAEIVWPTCAS